MKLLRAVRVEHDDRVYTAHFRIDNGDRILCRVTLNGRAIDDDEIIAAARYALSRMPPAQEKQ